MGNAHRSNFLWWVLLSFESLCNCSTHHKKFQATGASAMHQHQQIRNPPPPPTNSQSTTTTTITYNNTHTTTTQQKNKIKHLFETINLGILNFNHWFQRSWLLLDLISTGLVLLDVISVRLIANDGLRYYSTLSTIGERFRWGRDFSEHGWE